MTGTIRPSTADDIDAGPKGGLGGDSPLSGSS